MKHDPEFAVLKLRVSGLRKIKRSKTQEIIITRRVSEGFPETLRQTQKHNPSLTQRVGITANAQLQNFFFGVKWWSWLAELDVVSISGGFEGGVEELLEVDDGVRSFIGQSSTCGRS